ncbi:hypothetical protein HZ994_02360 [Akkermansiaceae bacterium]|nr:hypothetical protein HZ994_02360 [Akkermansiaceae bacterium]
MYNIQAHPPIDPVIPGNLSAGAALQSPEILKLWDYSKVPFEEIPQDPEQYITHGSPQDLICIGHHLRDMKTVRRSELVDPLNAHSIIVPAIMTKREGLLKDGSGSGPRTNENTAEPYAVVVSAPNLSLSTQFGIIGEFLGSASLAFVVWAGESHLEAWFSTRSILGPHEFFEEAIAFGADPSIKTRCQPYALPGGIHWQTRRQNTIVYLDPDALAEMHREDSKPPAVDETKAVAKNKRQRARSNGSRGKKQRS